MSARYSTLTTQAAGLTAEYNSRPTGYSVVCACGLRTADQVAVGSRSGTGMRTNGDERTRRSPEYISSPTGGRKDECLDAPTAAVVAPGTSCLLAP
ncbi:hypothetical protein MTO96_002871 [Rhipicephalus appendiculatus]